MEQEVTSKSLAGPSELVMIMPIKPGLVDCLATRSYRSRLKTVAEVFSDLRISSRESRLIQPFSDVVDRIQTIFAVHIAIVEDDKLLLSVAFDQPWETYIRIVWRDLGALLDPILCNCEGYTGIHSSDQGYQQFAAWIRNHQINTDTYYLRGSHTVSDILYLDQLEQHFRTSPPSDGREFEAATLRFATPEEIAASHVPSYPHDKPSFSAYMEFLKLGVKAVTAFHTLSGLYPKQGAEHHFLMRAAQDVLREFPHSSTWPKKSLGLRAMFKTEMDWFETVTKPTPPPADTRPVIAPTDIQGGIVTRYPANVGCTCLLRIDAAGLARKSLQAWQSQLSVEQGDPVDGAWRNISFTAQGIVNLGLAHADFLSLPREFRDGMAARAGVLGDLHANHPDQWELPLRNWPLQPSLPAQRVNLASVDVVVQLRTVVDDPERHTTFDADHPLYNEVLKLGHALEGGMTILAVESTYARPNSKEHFGFDDGISQPEVSLEAEVPAGDHGVPRGELFLGFANARGDRPERLPPALDGGTFLVMRKIEQHVKAYEDFVASAALDNQMSQDDVHAKLMGRYRNGMPLGAESRDAEFDFREDPGTTCPVQAHIRRANPRDGESPSPRIIRRGMSYGAGYDPDDPKSADVSRGMLFQAYNASLAEQFEVIQRWLTGGNRTGHYSRQSDPYLGVARPGESRDLKIPFDVGCGEVRTFRLSDHQFTTLRWGMYLFMPSMAGLQALCEEPAPAVSDELSNGEAIIRDLQALARHNPQRAKLRWKQVLEERDAIDDGDTRAVWRAIRELHGGLLRTPFGVLVGSAELVDQVLCEPDQFGVEHYRERLNQTINGNYLGDNPPEHDRAHGPNETLWDWLGAREAFHHAYLRTMQITQRFARIPGNLDIPLLNFADAVLAVIAKDWFGIPDGRTLLDDAPDPDQEPTPTHVHAGGEPAMGDTDSAHCPFHFTSPSRYVFQPHPNPMVADIATDEGQRLAEHIAAYTRATPDAKLTDLTRQLKAHGGDFSNLLLGALLGFMPTVQGNLVSVLREWVRSGDLWRVQDLYLTDYDAGAETDAVNAGPEAPAKTTEAAWLRASKHLEEPLAATMIARPVPAMVHRQARTAGRLGGLWIDEGATVVLGLTSAATQTNSTIPIFGGDYARQENKPTHACPGRRLANGVLLGVLAAFLEQDGTFRRTPSDLVLTLQRSA